MDPGQGFTVLESLVAKALPVLISDLMVLITTQLELYPCTIIGEVINMDSSRYFPLRIRFIVDSMLDSESCFTPTVAVVVVLVGFRIVEENPVLIVVSVYLIYFPFLG